ncbi:MULTISPECIES: hypothetical protein [unclassified Enterococcus]|uniref:hypothetical protein n=1 Tax=unclassified Enterococcus TaxID=2608891 RepID=UPI0013ED8ED6|nr:MULTISPECIES: hypothetical protein [unclassified Enterococcus]
MLESYIERNIFRKVYLCEQLFEFQEINIDEAAHLLHVSTPTIVHDLESMIECLEYCIEEHEKKKHLYRIVFKHGILLSELTQFLYGQSYFLRFLSYYFKGIFCSTALSDLEFISLSKVYAIKKTVLDFFKENHYLKAKQIIIPEFDIRNILLALVQYINWDGYENNNRDIRQACEELICYVETNFFKRRYPMEEKRYIQRGIEIALGRKNHPISFSEQDKCEAEKKPLFQLVAQGLQEQAHRLKLQEEDVYYIFSLFNSRNYTNENMELMRKDFDIVYEMFVSNHPILTELTNEISRQTQLTCVDHFIFKRSFLQFIRTFWGDGQIFLPEKIYLLTEKEQALYLCVVEILHSWKKKHELSIRWNENLVRKFVKSIYLTTDQESETMEREIFVVSDNPFKQIYYRQKLVGYIDEQNEINPTIYHHLDELAEEFLYASERIVFCEAAVYQKGFDTEKTKVVQISLKNIDEQLCRSIKSLHLEKERFTPQTF